MYNSIKSLKIKSLSYYLGPEYNCRLSGTSDIIQLACFFLITITPLTKKKKVKKYLKNCARSLNFVTKINNFRHLLLTNLLFLTCTLFEKFIEILIKT